MRKSRGGVSILLFVLIAVFALAMLGCEREERGTPDGVADRAAEATGEGTAFTDQPPTATDAVLAMSQPVEVEITDGEIRMPESLGHGVVALQVTNSSGAPRGFAVEGAGTTASLDRPLDPLEVRTLEVTLQPGTLVARAPAQGQPELTKRVTVTDEPQGDVAIIASEGQSELPKNER